MTRNLVDDPIHSSIIEHDDVFHTRMPNVYICRPIRIYPAQEIISEGIDLLIKDNFIKGSIGSGGNILLYPYEFLPEIGHAY